MADIKFAEIKPGAVKFKDTMGMLESRTKDVSFRTKEDLDIYRHKNEDAVTYAEETAGGYASETVMAARTAAVGTIRKSKINTLLRGKEQKTYRESADAIALLDALENEALGQHSSMLPAEGFPDRTDPFLWESQVRSYGGKHKVWPKGKDTRADIHARHDPVYVENSDKIGIRHIADIETSGMARYRLGSNGISGSLSSENSGTSGNRMKELAIRQIRGKPGNHFGERTLPIPFSRYHKSPSISGSMATRIGRLSKRLSALNQYLPIAGTVTVMVIVITIMFTATFSMTGNEDGNDFAYDFYEVSTGDHAIVEIAERQLGNIGGEKYWKWYGFSSHVQWCACFVSWCADQCGYIEAGIIPKFSIVGDGANWFREKHRWANGNYSPKPGDIIFFDYEKDGVLDHVGIVESCDGKTVTTIEGNSGDACKRQSYRKGVKSIAGYGVPVFRYPAVFDNACAWAARIAADDSFHYVNWQSGNSLTHECPVCHDHPAGNYRGWNCIGFAFACWRHGAGIRSRCSCSVVNDPNWEKLLHCSSDTEANRLATRLVGVPCTVIRNGGNAIPVNELRKGDILGLFNGSTYFHTIFYEGGGKYADCTSGRSDNVRANNTMSDSTKKRVKVAIRYIG